MSIFQRIFRKESQQRDDVVLARQVVQEYANFLNTSAPMPGCVADASELPFDKEMIKQSLYACISATEDPELIQHFKHGYLLLSAWQENVGDARLGLDFTAMDLDQDPETTAAEVQRQSDKASSWTPVVEAEQRRLATDLLTIGV